MVEYPASAPIDGSDNYLRLSSVAQALVLVSPETQDELSRRPLAVTNDDHSSGGDSNGLRIKLFQSRNLGTLPYLVGTLEHETGHQFQFQNTSTYTQWQTAISSDSFGTGGNNSSQTTNTGSAIQYQENNHNV